MSWRGRKVPAWIWLPFLLILAWGVVKLKTWQLYERSRQAHAPMYEEQAERDGRWRWTDSMIHTNAPARQRHLMAWADSFCNGKLGDSATADLRDFRDDGKRVTDWVGIVTVRDSLRVRSRLLDYTYEGALTDSIRRMAVPLHQHVARFAAGIWFSRVDTGCAPDLVLRDIRLTRVAGDPPTSFASHAAH